VSGAAEPLAEGDVVAPGYEVVEHLTRSAAYDVYDVWSDERDCRCAAKLVRPDRMDSAPTRRRLLNEGRLLERLTHPHVVRSYETIEKPQPVVVLETLSGATLAHLIESAPRRLPMSEVAWLGMHLCSALHYLHRHDLLHLDVKPSNVISDRGHAKLLDLSIARAPGNTRGGAGTAQYMSPEQARPGEVTTASDVWGLGATLYEATTGVRPFASRDGRYEQLERRAEPVRAHRRVPGALADTIDASLEPRPEDRPRLADVASAIEPLAAD
jgi:serine/threonine protein kinase